MWGEQMLSSTRTTRAKPPSSFQTWLSRTDVGFQLEILSFRKICLSFFFPLTPIPPVAAAFSDSRKKAALLRKILFMRSVTYHELRLSESKWVINGGQRINHSRDRLMLSSSLARTVK
ncbi:hypothetical protein CEXT_38961 [Caerostris extrusa]|uniref:Uncharacterized protein n=1 Tax=Caerostris extrusa TaxID=172846 RepID=A0AAV4NZQ7_CAEEX|nr:hypothetical protein CEXT_38961 [Caerostris extrusa]